MVFSKAFPVRTEKSAYPKWKDVVLSDAEEKSVDAAAREENINLMKECLSDAEMILKDRNMKDFQTNVVQLAISLFEKRASHSVYWKEEKAREKFEKG